AQGRRGVSYPRRKTQQCAGDSHHRRTVIMNSTAQPSHRTLTADNLREAPLAELLLYGLTLDDDDPALGVLQGARRELGLVASLAERCGLRTDFERAELAPGLA